MFCSLGHLKPLEPAGRSRSLPGGSILTVTPPHPSTCFDGLCKRSFQQLLVYGCSVESTELRINAGSTEGKEAS